MNYQKKPTPEILALIPERYRGDEFFYIARPYTTSGTGGLTGIGGQTVCTFTLETWLSIDNDYALHFMAGCIQHIDGLDFGEQGRDYLLEPKKHGWRRRSSPKPITGKQEPKP